MNFETLKDEYADLWDRASVISRFDGTSKLMAEKIFNSKRRYQEVERDTGVPWYWIGCIHALESGCRFSTHLHNGDPLTRRTRLVPAGRPKTGKPPFSWQESAIDALMMKGLHQVTEWSVPRMLYEAERYNGWGYRKYHPGTLSPYLWSGTPHYRSGKYVSDGKWSQSAVSAQTGVVPLLLRLNEIDPDIGLFSNVPKPVQPEPDPDIVPETYPKAEEGRVKEAVKGSKTIMGAITALISFIMLLFEGAFRALMDAASQMTTWGPIQSLFSNMGFNAKTIAMVLGFGGIALVIGRRINAAIKGKIG